MIDKLILLPHIDILNIESDSGIVTFNVNDLFSEDVAYYLNKYNVCVRAGHHCAQLVTRFLNQISTTRASFYFYNTEEDVYALVDAVKKAKDFFSAF